MKKLLSLLTLLPLVTYALDAPLVSITCEQVSDSVEVTLSWVEILDATQYCIFSRGDAPYGVSELVGCVDQSPYVFKTIDQQFYYVVAEDNPEPPPNMTLIPAGTFTMGDDEDVYTWTSPEHQVTLTHDFYLGTCAVTNEEYRAAVQWAYDQGLVTATSSTVQAHGEELLDLDALDCEIAFSNDIFSLVMRTHDWGGYGPGYAYPSGYDPADHPVKVVSWYGAVCYCDWLSMMDGVGAFYNGNWDQSAGHNPYTSLAYRLPTEAEWEHAVSYHDGRIYPWGDEVIECYYANFYYNYDFCVGWTTPVGSYPTGNSQLGLQNMAGNIWEWVGDIWGLYDSGSQTDPFGPTSGTSRVIRGGSWASYGYSLCCANRGNSYPNYSNSGIGLRVARTATR